MHDKFSNSNDQFCGRNHYIYQNSLKILLERDFTDCPVLGWLFHPEVEFYAHHIGINVDLKSSEFNISRFCFIGEWKSGLYVGFRNRESGHSISNYEEYLKLGAGAAFYGDNDINSNRDFNGKISKF